jgi:amino acid adenylation domain-containing protein
LPLLRAQRDIWFGNRLDASGCAYNTGLYTAISGALDLAALQQAAAHVVACTDALRLRFHAEHDELRQEIIAAGGYVLPIADVSQATDPEAAGLALIAENLRTPFHLASEAQFRWLIVRTGGGRCLFGQTYHHIALDGQSSWIVSHRLAESYSALVRKEALPDYPSGSIATLIEQEASYRASQRRAEDRTYWTAALGVPEQMRSWSGRARHTASNGAPLRETRLLPLALATELRAQAARAGVRPEHLVMAAAGVLQAAHQGERSIVLGTQLLGRLASSVRAHPAMASNECLVPLIAAPELTLAGLAKDISRRMRLALRHQSYRYEDVRGDLGVLPGAPDPFSLSVNIMPVDADLGFEGLTAASHYLSYGPVRDLELTIFDNRAKDELRVDLDGNGALYAAADVQAHLANLVSILAQAAEGTETIGAFRLTAEHAMPPAVAGHEVLPDVLASVAAADPETIAVVSGTRAALTYGELEQRSNRLARHLIGRGAAPESVVAIFLPRGAELVIAVLAVLKAGAACLLLDTDHADARLRLMLGDSGAKLLITQSSDVFSGADVSRIVFGEFDNELAIADPAPLTDRDRHGPLVPENLAFLFYTSGSTGRPKGVALTHANFAHKLRSHARLWDVGPSSRFAFTSALGFDPCVHQMLLPLIHGGAVVAFNGHEMSDPDLFADVLARSAVTHLDIVPSFAAILADRADLPALKSLILGGEVLPAPLAAKLRACLPYTRLFNMYGPTEATVDAAGYEIFADIPDAIPIGRALDGYAVHILDEGLRPLPRGALGEICISGAGVARGYWNNAQLTAERFVPCPFGAPGERMYRTGDRGWRDAKGDIFFAGRTDDQIKLRGVRIEPGEIEAVLLTLPCVGQAAVIAEGGTRLVAYVSPSSGAALDGQALRSALAERLPDVMVPSQVTVLEHLPRLPNGKTDRKNLPQTGAEETPLYVAPHTGLEARICALFGVLTGTERVSVDDNFFALGGHSLLVMKFIADIRREGFDVPVELLFAHPTPRALALAMSHHGEAAPVHRPRIALRAAGTLPPLICVHPAGGLAQIYGRVLGGLDTAIPVYGLNARGIFDEAPPHASISEMARAYVEAIGDLNGPLALTGWSFGGVVAQEMAAMLEEQGATVERVVLIDTYFRTVEADLDAADAVASMADGAAGPLFERMQEAVVRSARLLDAHAPRRISAPLIFLRASDNREADLASKLAKLTRGKVEIEEMTAGHYQLFEPEHAGATAAMLNRHLLPALETAQAV